MRPSLIHGLDCWAVGLGFSVCHCVHPETSYSFHHRCLQLITWWIACQFTYHAHTSSLAGSNENLCFAISGINVKLKVGLLCQAWCLCFTTLGFLHPGGPAVMAYPVSGNHGGDSRPSSWVSQIINGPSLPHTQVIHPLGDEDQWTMHTHTHAHTHTHTHTLQNKICLR